MEDGGIRGMPKEPRLQRKAGHAQGDTGILGIPPPEWGSKAPAGSTGLALTEALLQGSSEN